MLSNYGHSSYICGDSNINLLKIGIKSHFDTFFENMLSSGFYPEITLPTRICNTSSTIIDNIFSNEICSNDASGIFVNHISDHQTIFTITSTKLKNGMEQQYVSIETKDDVSLNNFITEVRNMNISEILNGNINANPTENYELFSKLVQEAKSKHLPIKRIKFNKYKHKKCRWITNGILKSIKTKDIIFKMLKQANPANVEAFEILKTRFNRFHNILRQSIKEAQHIYYLRSFEKFKHDIKQTWSIISVTCSNEIDLNFNATKSFCVAFTLKHYKLLLPSLFMNSLPILYADSIKYLGFIFTSNNCDDSDILKQMRMLYCRSNRLVRLFNKCSKPVLLELCRSFCTVFYCPYFWTQYKKTTFSKIRVAYNNVYRKILGVSRRASASGMFVSNDIPNFEAFLRKSIYSFTTRLSSSSNKLICAIEQSWTMKSVIWKTWEEKMYI